MKPITINILDSVDIESITADTIKEDNATASHYNNLCNLIEMLTMEKKAIDKALITKHENKTYKNDTVSISVYDSMILDTDSLIADIGKDRYEKHKTKVKHTERVVRFGK